jgi:hypothetical protein
MWKRTSSPWNTSRFTFIRDTIATYISSATTAPVLSSECIETLAGNKRKGVRVYGSGFREKERKCRIGSSIQDIRVEGIGAWAHRMESGESVSNLLTLLIIILSF